jgi:hypothetical protein
MARCVVDANELSALVEELQDQVERLRALYEQYFMGIERLEPLILRKDVDRRVWQLRREPIRNTALRFKIQTTIQRYNTYQQHWQRVCREIESGTYYRDVSRAAARFGDVALTAMGRKRQKMFEKGLAKRAERAVNAAKQSTAPEPSASETPLEASASEAHSLAPLQAKAPPPPSPAALPASPPLGLDLESLADLAPLAEQLIDSIERGHGTTPPRDASVKPERIVSVHPPAESLFLSHDVGSAPERKPARPAPASQAPPRPKTEDLTATRMRELYKLYVEAKRRCHEPVADVTFERLSANLRDTADALRLKHPGRQIAFDVVIKNGTAVLKAIVGGKS